MLSIGQTDGQTDRLVDKQTDRWTGEGKTMCQQSIDMGALKLEKAYKLDFHQRLRFKPTTQSKLFTTLFQRNRLFKT